MTREEAIKNVFKHSKSYCHACINTRRKRGGRRMICNTCLHADVCGVEGSFEESMTYCADYLGRIPCGERLIGKTGEEIIALLEKTYADFCECESGEGWLKIDGKEYSTDAGYVIDGMRIFMEVFSIRLADKEKNG